MRFKLNQQKLTFILITAVVLTGLIILAGTLSQLELNQGETFNLLALLRGRLNPMTSTSTPAVREDNGLLPGFLLILFWVGLAASIVYAFISPKYRRRVLNLMLMIVLLFFLADRFIPELLKERMERLADNTALLEPSSSFLPQPPAYVADPPDWISWVVSGVASLLLVGSGFYIWYQRRQPDSQKMLVQEADRALQDLAAGSDLKDVVLRCYSQMEGVMRQSQHIERQQSMTPREFESHLAIAGFSDEHIGRLVRLFEDVRYGARPSDGRAEREARDCLSAIVASYG